MITSTERPPVEIAGYDPLRDAGDCWYSHVDAELAVEFIESECCHVKGRWALKGEKLLLQAWQRDFVKTLYGWKRPDGTRRYRLAYVEVPRKNGKSTMLASLVLTSMLCPRFADAGAELYSAASDREQASIVYSVAAAMVRANSLMKARCKVRDSRKRIIVGNSYYTAIAANEHGVHGFNPSLVVADELHRWLGDKGRGVWDGLLSGMGSRAEPLMLAITTAGYDRQSVCWEQHCYAENVRSGAIVDPSFLPVLYAADDRDDWTSPATWAKANPNLGVSITEEFLRQECERAKQVPPYENTFRNMYLNQWTEQAVRWMPMELWDQCAAPFDESELRGKPCWGALDIASTRDLASFVLVFPHEDGWRVKCWFWCPQEAATIRDRQDRQGYSGWVGRWVNATSGNSIDQSAIRQVMHEAAKLYRIKLVAFDDWNMTECYQQLVREGWPESRLVKFPQTAARYTEPMKKLLELVREHKLWHNGNPVLRWCASNVVAKTDPAGNIRPDKGKSQDKIDGFTALAMALGGAIASAKPATGSLIVT